MSRVFVMGVDGGSYPLIKKFINEGYLPNFKKVIEKGKFCEFESTIPPHTAPGWVSIATGTNPGTHGIYQFWKTQGSKYVGDFQGSYNWNATPIWKILNEYGLKTGMVNIPMTHPPMPVDGYIITWPLTKTLNYSYPRELLSEIASEGGHYYPDLYTMYTGQEDYLERACEITRKRVKTIKYLMQNKEWDFMMAVFTEVDRISHYTWQYMDKTSPCYEENPKMQHAVRKIYEETDKALGEILENLPKDTLFVSLSDHGFDVGLVNFNINTFLINHGYMSLKEVGSGNKGEENLVGSDMDYSNWFQTTIDGKQYEVDFENTKVFMAAPGSYGLNINLQGRQEKGIVSDKEYHKLISQLKQELSELEHPFKKEKLFKEILSQDEAYSGEKQGDAPDIICIPNGYGIMVNHKIIPDQLFSLPDQKGMHERDGYILFYGDGIDENKELEKVQIIDFAPTILQYYGISKTDKMEGKALDVFDVQVLQKDFRQKIHKEVVHQTYEDNEIYTYSGDEKREMEQRLKGLGYL